MRGKMGSIAGILIMGVFLVSMIGCGKKDDRSVLFEGDTETTDDTALPVIDEDSRQVVEWKLPYDPEAGELSDTFIVAFADDYQGKTAVLDSLKNSDYCENFIEYYDLSTTCFLTKEVHNSEYLEWYSQFDPEGYETICTWFENDGVAPADLRIVSTPDQTENLLTMPWTLAGSGGYAGELMYNLYAGDEITFQYYPQYDSTMEGKEVSVTIDRVTMDTPWYINENYELPEVEFILSWDEFTAFEENPDEGGGVWYVFLDGGKNQELHDLAKSLRKECNGADSNDGDRNMFIFENQQFFR